MKGKMKILPASIEQILVEVKKQFKEEQIGRAHV